MAHHIRNTGAAGLIAAASLAFAPAQAAEVAPQTATNTASVLAQSTLIANPAGPFAAPGADSVQEWGRYGWRRGWRGRGWRGRRGVRAGDVIAGVAILGGIAAIASAASNNRRRDRDVVVVERERVRDRDYDYRPENRRNTARSTNSGSGIDNAVSMCLNQIEQDIRVNSVDGASRVGSGWIVTGSLFDGSGFSCQIDNSGRISGIDYGRGGGVSSLSGSQSFAYSNGQPAAGQLSDDMYANARADVGGTTRPDLAIDPNDQRLPAYPGGPLPGEEAGG